jgi:hypothetical protein
MIQSQINNNETYGKYETYKKNYLCTIIGLFSTPAKEFVPKD